MKRLVAIVGTNSDFSTNRLLLKFMHKHFADKAQIEVVEIKDLPLFNKPANFILPDVVKELAEKVEQADGIIISSPEYDHSVPAVLINALNWLSYGIYPFVDKPVMLTGASYGTLGSSRAQWHLRQILDAPELKARIMPSSEFLVSHSLQAFDDEGCLKNAQQIESLEAIFDDFLVFISLIEPLKKARKMNQGHAQAFSWEEQERGE